MTKGVYSKRYRHFDASGVHACIRGSCQWPGRFTPPQTAFPFTYRLKKRLTSSKSIVHSDHVCTLSRRASHHSKPSAAIFSLDPVQFAVLARLNPLFWAGNTHSADWASPVGTQFDLTKVMQNAQIGLRSGDHCSLDSRLHICEATLTYLIDTPLLSGSWVAFSRGCFPPRKQSIEAKGFRKRSSPAKLVRRFILGLHIAWNLGKSVLPERSNQPAAVCLGSARESIQ